MTIDEFLHFGVDVSGGNVEEQIYCSYLEPRPLSVGRSFVTASLDLDGHSLGECQLCLEEEDGDLVESYVVVGGARADTARIGDTYYHLVPFAAS